jgi:hypothetical protein
VTGQSELATAIWWKAEASSGSGDCVEVAHLTTGGAVRHSRNVAGGALRAGHDGMSALILSAKSGALRPPPALPPH